jgi:hypothetical protein
MTAAAGLRALGQAISGEEDRGLVGEASQTPEELSAITPVVPNYRCGAAPEWVLWTAPDSLLSLFVKTGTAGPAHVRDDWGWMSRDMMQTLAHSVSYY